MGSILEMHIEPEACTRMADIRREIDRIDQYVISLFGQRFKYIQAASRLNTPEADAMSHERFKSMLKKRREWAIENGLNPDLTEMMYRNLAGCFVDDEIACWKLHQDS